MFYQDEIGEYEMCQYCGIELLEDREVANETCYICMRSYATELGRYERNEI